MKEKILVKSLDKLSDEELTEAIRLAARYGAETGSVLAAELKNPENMLPELLYHLNLVSILYYTQKISEADYSEWVEYAVKADRDDRILAFHDAAVNAYRQRHQNQPKK
jgi:hypothetical protein